MEQDNLTKLIPVDTIESIIQTRDSQCKIKDQRALSVVLRTAQVSAPHYR